MPLASFGSAPVVGLARAPVEQSLSTISSGSAMPAAAKRMWNPSESPICARAYWSGLTRPGTLPQRPPESARGHRRRRYFVPPQSEKDFGAFSFALGARFTVSSRGFRKMGRGGSSSA